MNNKNEHNLSITTEIKQKPKLDHLVLQAPKQELEEVIIQQLELNPAIEIIEEGETSDEMEIDLDILREDEKEVDEGLQKFLEEELPSFYLPEQEEDKQTQIPAVFTLKDILNAQIDIAFSDPKINQSAKFVIEYIDKDGYIRTPPEVIAKDLKMDVSDVQNIIKEIKEFSPPGIGAKDLRESLLIQLRYFNEENTVAYKILDMCYEEFKENAVEKIAEKIKVSEDDVKKAIKRIKQLNPRPSADFTGGAVEYIVPDVFCEYKNGKYVVKVDDSYIPPMRISAKFKEMLLAPEKYTKEEIRWVKEKVKRALYFFKLLEDRKKHLKRLVEFLIERQKDFIENGKSFLKPLSLKEIAEKLNLSDSTISRMLKSRYLQTPKGVIPLRDFLSRSIRRYGGRVSQDMVKEIVRKIIENESEPVSDDEICKALNSQGFKISRRTIAKYRKDMGIPPKNRRKRRKDA